MAIDSVQNYSVSSARPYFPNFKGNESVKEIDKGDYIEKHFPIEATTEKKWLVGIASAIIPGLGQFINADGAKGLAFLSSSIIASVVAVWGGMRAKAGSYIAGLGLCIWSIVDAVKNAKSETIQIVPKENK